MVQGPSGYTTSITFRDSEGNVRVVSEDDPLPITIDGAQPGGGGTMITSIEPTTIVRNAPPVLVTLTGNFPGLPEGLANWVTISLIVTELATVTETEITFTAQVLSNTTSAAILIYTTHGTVGASFVVLPPEE